MARPRIVNVTGGRRVAKVWTDEFVAALEARGDLTLHTETGPLDDDELTEIVGAHDVAIVGWDAHPLPASLATARGDLAYVCCYSGTIRSLVPRELVEAGVPVSNWGELPAQGIAESAMTLLLACVHDLGVIRRAQRAGEWGFDTSRVGTLAGLRVGIHGLGVIGHRFVEMLRPFGAHVRAHDPYVAELPPGVERAHTVDELCDWADALVIYAGLTDETAGSVGLGQLARLPDGGIVVNTARGAIIDQEALFAELATGRLRAGLDVLEPDGVLDPAHPLRQADNVTFSFHRLTFEGGDDWPPRPGLTRMQQLVVDQLDRFAAGDEPWFVFDTDRYDRST